MLKKISIFVFIVFLVTIIILLPFQHKNTFTIMTKSELETELHILDSGKKGPTVFVIAGIHGNEVASIYACDSLKNIVPKRGKVIILPRANKIACDNSKRTMYYMQDLNREFPGKENGTDTQKLAWEIIGVINKDRPEIILDLHESAKAYTEGEHYLGNSIIFTPIDLSTKIVMYILENMNRNIEEGLKFTCFTGAPKGSINREVSNSLDIPVITVETNEQLPIDAREKQHLDIIKLVLKYYGMDD